MAKVLLADSQTDILDLMREWLNLRGYQVATASNATEALHAASLGQPDLILLDEALPPTGGIDLCHTLREAALASRTPIILITNSDPVAARLQAWTAGASEAMSRPIALSHLARRMSALLGKPAQGSERTDMLVEEIVHTGLAALGCEIILMLEAKTGAPALRVTAAAASNGISRLSTLDFRDHPLPLNERGWYTRAATLHLGEFNRRFADLPAASDPVYQVCQTAGMNYVSLIPLETDPQHIRVLLAASRQPLDIELDQKRRTLSMLVDMLCSAVSLESSPASRAQLTDDSWARDSEPTQQQALTAAQAIIAEMIQVIHSRATANEKLQSILNGTTKALHAQSASALFLTEQDGSELVIQTAAGLRAHRLEGIRVPMDGSLAGMVMHSGRVWMGTEPNYSAADADVIVQQLGLMTASMAAAPIHVRGEAAGALLIGRKGQDPFPPFAEEFLQSASGLLGIVLERSLPEPEKIQPAPVQHMPEPPSEQEKLQPEPERLQPESQLLSIADTASLQRLLLVREASKAAISQPAIKFIETITQLLVKRLSMPWCSIMRVSEDGDTLTVIGQTASLIWPLEQARWINVPEWPGFERVLASGEPLALSPHEEDVGVARHADLAGFGMQSIVLIPIRLADRISGMAEVCHADPDHLFSEADLERCAASIEQWAASIKDPDGWLKNAALSGLADKLLPAAGADWCRIFSRLPDDTALAVVCEAGRSLWVDSGGQTQKLDEDSLRRAVLEQGNCIKVDALDKRLSPADRVAVRHIANGSIVFAPIIVAGEARGMIQLVDLNSVREFTATDTLAVETVASLTGCILENDRLRQLAGSSPIGFTIPAK